MKKALITGINGQDGSYLSEFLLEKGYEVHGILKRNSVAETQTTRIEHIRSRINLYYADITDLSSLIYVIKEIQPAELYHLAAQSHVRISFDQPIYTANATGLSTVNVLEAVRLMKPDIKVYQASSSEMFGNTIDLDGFQRETTSSKQPDEDSRRIAFWAVCSPNPRRDLPHTPYLLVWKRCTSTSSETSCSRLRARNQCQLHRC